MIIIVVGMHRSGTSALAGVLHQNGISMGDDKDFYPPPMRENPKGFFENVRFRRINDALLDNGGYKVKSWGTVIPVVEADISQRARMRDLINYYCGNHENWGWKDPRTSLCLHQWLSVLAEMRLAREVFIINCLRHPIDVSNSMKARGNKEKFPGQFESVTCAYQDRLLNQMTVWRSGIAGYTEVFFNHLVLEPERALKELSAKMSTRISNNGFIEADIARNVDKCTLRAGKEISACI